MRRYAVVVAITLALSAPATATATGPVPAADPAPGRSGGCQRRHRLAPRLAPSGPLR